MSFHLGLFWRVVALVIVLGTAAFLGASGYPYNSVLLFCAGALLVAELFRFTRIRTQHYEKVLLAMLHEDFSASLPTDKNGQFATLYKLYEIQRRGRNELQSRQQLFASLLENIDSAILILKQSDDGWNVFLMNGYFSDLFGVPAFRHWNDLRKRVESLASVLENSGFAEMKTSAEIRINEGELQTFSLRASRTQSFGDDYYVVLLDSIQKVVERKEKQAWINLMNVISHELMNSLTPIQSLSHSLNEIIASGAPGPEELDDIRQGLGTIANRSDHLKFFVENYRKLTILPTPQKEAADLGKLIGGCLSVMEPILKRERISVENTIQTELIVQADKRQLEQVFINLITNAVYALDGQLEKRIFVSAHSEKNRVFISVSDNGKGVESAIRDKIFLPFFTTRKDGAGIGLTLSRNIIEAHGGYLNYEPKDGKAEFVVCLIG